MSNSYEYTQSIITAALPLWTFAPDMTQREGKLPTKSSNAIC